MHAACARARCPAGELGDCCADYVDECRATPSTSVNVNGGPTSSSVNVDRTETTSTAAAAPTTPEWKVSMAASTSPEPTTLADVDGTTPEATTLPDPTTWPTFTPMTTTPETTLATDAPEHKISVAPAASSGGDPVADTTTAASQTEAPAEATVVADTTVAPVDAAATTPAAEVERSGGDNADAGGSTGKGTKASAAPTTVAPTRAAGTTVGQGVDREGGVVAGAGKGAKGGSRAKTTAAAAAIASDEQGVDRHVGGGNGAKGAKDGKDSKGAKLAVAGGSSANGKGPKAKSAKNSKSAKAKGKGKSHTGKKGADNPNNGGSFKVSGSGSGGAMLAVDTGLLRACVITCQCARVRACMHACAWHTTGAHHGLPARGCDARVHT